eukprot:4927300-Heterocapsa_arctica.AAC.1
MENAFFVGQQMRELITSEHITEEDKCHPCDGKVKKVYIDGSSFKVGASNYSGWGIRTPDEQSFNEMDRSKVNSRARTELRLERCCCTRKSEQQIE